MSRTYRRKNITKYHRCCINSSTGECSFDEYEIHLDRSMQLGYKAYNNVPKFHRIFFWNRPLRKHYKRLLKYAIDNDTLDSLICNNKPRNTWNYW